MGAWVFLYVSCRAGSLGQGHPRALGRPMEKVILRAHYVSWRQTRAVLPSRWHEGESISTATGRRTGAMSVAVPRDRRISTSIIALFPTYLVTGVAGDTMI